MPGGISITGSAAEVVVAATDVEVEGDVDAAAEPPVVGAVDDESEQAANASAKGSAKTHKTPPEREGPRYDRVEVRGIEPLASTVRLLRSAN
jgi:hypothetical protein